MIICNQSRGYGVNLKLRILDQGIEARADILLGLSCLIGYLSTGMVDRYPYISMFT